MHTWNDGTTIYMGTSTNYTIYSSAVSSSTSMTFVYDHDAMDIEQIDKEAQKLNLDVHNMIRDRLL